MPAGAALIVCLAVMTAPGWATEPRAAEVAGTDAHADAEAGADADEYAHTHGVTVRDARERLAQQDELGALKEQVREAAGDRLARAYTGHEEFYGLLVTLTAGPALPEVEQLLAQSGHPYRLTYAPVLSESEGAALTESLAATALRGVDGVDGLYYDGASGTISMYYSGVPGSTALLRAEEFANQHGARLHVTYSDVPAGDA